MALLTPFLIVVVIPAWPEVVAAVTVTASPPLLALSFRVWDSIVPVEDLTGFAGAVDPPRLMQEGEIFHHFNVIAQNVDLAALDVAWFVVVGVAPVWFSDREHHLLGDVAGVIAPGPEVKGPSALTASGGLL
jgi:hypothetical protein